jgi:putative transcriptional regulator
MKNTLRVERAILKITQAELAQKVNVSRQSINAIEISKYVPTTILALKLALFFQKKVEEIFILEDTD